MNNIMADRYSRQTQLPEIGVRGQLALGAARVAVIGCGALGSLVAMYLAGAGIGKIIIADFDTVDISNLHRQLFFTENECGKPKVSLLRKRMEALNRQIKVTELQELVRPELLHTIAPLCEVVIDATDNPESKRMVSEVCREIGKPCIIGGVDGWRGQVMTCVPGGTYYNDVFPAEESDGFTPCRLGGVVGPVAGMVASLQATEAIKLITGCSSEGGELFLLDTLTMQSQTIKI